MRAKLMAMAMAVAVLTTGCGTLGIGGEPAATDGPTTATQAVTLPLLGPVTTGEMRETADILVTAFAPPRERAAYQLGLAFIDLLGDGPLTVQRMRDMAAATAVLGPTHQAVASALLEQLSGMDGSRLLTRPELVGLVANNSALPDDVRARASSVITVLTMAEGGQMSLPQLAALVAALQTARDGGDE